jgi:hypothetical protein
MNHGCVFIDNVFDQFLKNSCTFEKKISCKVDKCDKMIMTCFLHKYTTNGHVKAIGAWCSLKKIFDYGLSWLLNSYL